MTDPSFEKVRSLLDAPSPAVLATNRKDGSAFVSPVWFRWAGGDAAERTKPGILLRLAARQPRVWDLAPILPS